MDPGEINRVFQIITYTGNAARFFLRETAKLRIAVLREFPYLAEDSYDYKMEYLLNRFSEKKPINDCNRKSNDFYNSH